MVSRTVCVVPGLQISAPVTALIGPGVPLELVPLMTNPSTSKVVAPVLRLTLACPFRTVQAVAPARMPATGLSTPGVVITPTILFQRTTESSLSKPKAAAAHTNAHANRQDEAAQPV